MDTQAREVDVTVIGAGQAGLSAAYFLRRAGFSAGTGYVVLDADDGPGGAWRHRWPSLRFDRAHGFFPLPGMPVDGVDGVDATMPAATIVAEYFAAYERHFDLPVRRPVRALAVRDHADGRLLIETDAGDWSTRALLNATGTWTRPFWPRYPGMETFGGRQLHTADYERAEDFVGQHVVVVGGGHSAVQLLAEISEVTTTTWVTRREPDWREGPFDSDAGRAAVAMVEAAVREGRRPSSVVSVTGLIHTPATLAAQERGALDRLPMFDRITGDGVAWDDGRFVKADVILWATGFRWALDHLAPLRLRERGGGITMDGTMVARDPRVHLLGYGPSASTIGANRAGRAAVRDVRAFLAGTRAPRPGAERVAAGV
jgi:cation diffusion facilitator CzcD-associated flavoprotein CzcO